MNRVEQQVEKLESYAADVHSKLQELCNRNDTLRIQRDGAKEDAARYQRLLKEYIAASKNKKEGWRKERAELCSKISKLQTMLDDGGNDFQQLVRKQEEESRRVVAEKEQLQEGHLAALKAAEIRTSQLELQVKKLQQSLASEKQESAHLNSVILDLENQLSATENSLSRKEEEQNKMKKRIEILDLVKAELESKLKNAMLDIEARDWRIDDLKMQIGDLIEFEKANSEWMHAEMMEITSQRVFDIKEGLRALKDLDLEVGKLKARNGHIKSQPIGKESKMSTNSRPVNSSSVGNSSRNNKEHESDLKELEAKLIDSEARALSASQKVLALENEIRLLRANAGRWVESSHPTVNTSNIKGRDERACYKVFAPGTARISSTDEVPSPPISVEYEKESTSHHRRHRNDMAPMGSSNPEESDLAAKLTLAEAHIIETELGAKALRMKIERLEDEVEKWKRQADDHKEKHALSLIEIEVLKQECSKYQENNTQSKASLVSLEQKLAAEQEKARQEMEEMSSRLKSAEASATQAQGDAQALQDELAQKSRAVEQLSKERDALMEAIQELQSTCVQMAGLEAGNLESAKRVEALEAMVKDKNAELEQLSKKLQKAQIRISATEGFLHELTASKLEKQLNADFEEEALKVQFVPKESLGKENIARTTKELNSKQYRRPGILKQHPNGSNQVEQINKSVSFLR